MAIKIQIRRDTEANWISEDPVLADGELALSTDLTLFKVGNGTDVWSDLEYFNEGGGTPPGGTDGAVQYNDSGALGGQSDGSFAFDKITKTLSLIGHMIIGSGAASKKLKFPNDIYTLQIGSATLNDDRSLLLPDKNGTVAVTSDIPTSLPGSDDYLSTLLNSEIAITTTANLTISRQHLISGTSADYTVTLPAASGNAGKYLSVRISNAATKLFTIDGNGSETIDGALTRILWAGESATLYCDGSNWFKVAGRSIAMTARADLLGGDQGVSGVNTWTAVVMDTLVYGPAGMWDSGNGRLKAARPGRYVVVGSPVPVGSSWTGALCGCAMNSAVGNGGASMFPALLPTIIYGQGQGVFDAAVNDYFVATGYAIGSGSGVFSHLGSSMTVVEQLTW